MSATHFLATDDPDLLRTWWAAVQAGRPVVTLNDAAAPSALPPGVPVVVVLDAAASHRLPAGLEKCPTIFIGEPGSMPFEQARQTGRARIFLSYEDSRTRLHEFLPLVEEIAERAAAVEMLAEKARRAGDSRPPIRPTGWTWTEAPEVWDFLEAAVENLGSRTRLLGEFRRAARFLLHASHALFFLRDNGGFKSDRGDFVCPGDDPLIKYLSSYPAVLDGTEWPAPADPMAEMGVRHRLMVWSARLIIPVHDNGRLLGLVALGVRDDGHPYDAADRARAIFFARLLRQFLSQSTQVEKFVRQHERWQTGEKYFPNILILDPDEAPSRHLPLIVRTLAGEVRQSRETKRVLPTAQQPYRISAGIIAETQCIWVCWEDATEELRERTHRERFERLALLHDLALTLNHELGNSLVSLIALRHNPGAETNSPMLLAAIKRDIANLETINQHLASIPTFREVDPEASDLRELLRALGETAQIPVDVGHQSVALSVVPNLLEFALTAILDSLVENRPDFGKRGLSVHLRSSGEGEELTALISIKGEKLALEGILPAPEAGDIPGHGRIGVFIAKEIIRLHGGEILSGPGAEGPEILISLRNW